MAAVSHEMRDISRCLADETYYSSLQMDHFEQHHLRLKLTNYGSVAAWLPPGGEPAAALQHLCYPPRPTFEDQDRAASASRSHSEAEKRRRDRINAQFSTLRKLIPMSEKMDKAALLEHVVEHVKELKRQVKEVCKLSTIPTETDEVSIEFLDVEEESGSRNEENTLIKASICCDDRPELFSEINGALKGLGLNIGQVDMTSLGGRIKANFVLCREGWGTGRDSCPSSLKQSLNIVLNRIVISSSVSSYSARSKRQRFFLS